MTVIDLQAEAATPLSGLSWWRQWPAMRHVARARAAAMYAYRTTMLLFMGVTVMQIFILKRVWSALYAVRPDALAIPFEDLAVYLTLTNLIVWSFPTHTVTAYLRQRIRDGSVVFDLVRPLGFLSQLISQLVGALGGALVIVVIALPVVAVAGSLALPAGLDAAGLFLISMLLGYAIAGMLTLLLAMIAFWTVEVFGITMLYILVANFFSGALVPISVFPGGLRTLVEWLPFQATTYVPASIYIGTIEGEAAWRAIGLQVLWVMILMLVTVAVWRRAVRRVVVQGG